MKEPKELIIHSCEKNERKECLDKWNWDVRKEIVNAGVSDYGPAVGKIVYIPSIDAWIASNDEYATIVRFCPWCGKELKCLSSMFPSTERS